MAKTELLLVGELSVGGGAGFGPRTSNNLGGGGGVKPRFALMS